MLLSKLNATQMANKCKVSEPHCEVILANVKRLAPPNAIAAPGMGQSVEIRFDPTVDAAFPATIEVCRVQGLSMVIVEMADYTLVIRESARDPQALRKAEQDHYRIVRLADLGSEIEKAYCQTNLPRESASAPKRRRPRLFLRRR